MYYVYVLQNKTRELYIGATNDLRRRLSEHNAGRSHSTKGKKWSVVYYEAYKSEKDARRREGKLKLHGRAKRWLKERIQDSLQDQS